MRTGSRPYRSIPTHEQQHGVRFARSSLRRVHPRGWDASSRLWPMVEKSRPSSIHTRLRSGPLHKYTPPRELHSFVVTRDSECLSLRSLYSGQAQGLEWSCHRDQQLYTTYNRTTGHHLCRLNAIN